MFKQKIIMIILSIGFAAPFAQARDFYKSSFKVSVDYASLNSGTVNLVVDKNVEIRYSDDHEFCELHINAEIFECDTYHDDQRPSGSMVTLDREIAASLLHEAIKETLPELNTSIISPMCNHKRKRTVNHPPKEEGPDYLGKFDRLAEYLLDPINLEVGMSFDQQLHDRESESFHVWLGELSEGIKY